MPKRFKSSSEISRRRGALNMIYSGKFSRSVINRMLNAFAVHKIVLDEKGNAFDYEYIEVNPAFEAFTGLKAADIIGKRYSEIIPGNQNETTDWIGIYGKVASTGKPVSFESYTAAFDKWVVVNAYSPVKGYFITIFSDISDVKRSEQKLRKMVYQDHLTGLPNRMALYEKLQERIRNAPDTRKALFFVDSDNFKFLNDTLGHSFGDLLIMEIAKRLLVLFGKENVYRLGGDEFIIYFDDFDSLNHLSENAQKIMQSFVVPYEIKDSTIYTTVSIGIATYPEGGDNTEELMRNADIAMYQAKFSGKNKYVFYRPDMHEKVKQRVNIEKHLRGALSNNEFQIYYQPQVDIVSGSITGFEALLRWNSPELGFVSPLNFINIAEETHMILPIGEWVLRNSCFFLKQMHSRGYDQLTMSVNISMLQLIQEDFVDSVLQLLEFIDLQPQYLELEITETILMESYKAVHDKLLQLKSAGVKIALDDFGQGYSSLSYLKLLPINTLKIDKSFIDGVNREDNSDNLTSAIIMIGNKMGLTLLAEGVEEKEQLDYLKGMGCHRIQGYLISKPLPQDEAIRFVTVWR